MSDKFLNSTGLTALRNWIIQKLGLKQDTLVSGTNIKTINSQSILGSGDLEALTRNDLTQVLENHGVDHLEVDEDGYLKISGMYFNTPYNAGYITDRYGNFIHSRDTATDSWNIVSNDGTPKLIVSYEGNVRNKIGAGLEAVHSLIDAKQTNNGISSQLGMPYSRLYDKNDLNLGGIRVVAYPNGDIYHQWYARSYNTSGEQVVEGQISMGVSKSGNIWYAVSNPNEFRKAIGASTNTTVRRLDQSGDVTQTGASYKTIPSAFSYTTKTGRFIAIASVPLKTSRFTSHAAIMVNGTEKGIITINSQTMIITNPMTFETFDPNTTVTIGIGINAQDSGTTVTIPAYNSPIIAVFDLPI